MQSLSPCSRNAAMWRVAKDRSCLQPCETDDRAAVHCDQRLQTMLCLTPVIPMTSYPSACSSWSRYNMRCSTVIQGGMWCASQASVQTDRNKGTGKGLQERRHSSAHTLVLLRIRFKLFIFSAKTDVYAAIHQMKL